MGVHDRLASVRRDSGLTQEEFGKRVGVSKNTQTRYERGHRFPDTEYLERVARNFGIDLNWLVSGEEENPFAARDYTLEELEALRGQFTHTFGMSRDDFDDLLSWLQLRSDRARLDLNEQAILNAYRSTDHKGKRALLAVAGAVAREEQANIVYPNVWSAAAMANALQTALDRRDKNKNSP